MQNPRNLKEHSLKVQHEELKSIKEVDYNNYVKQEQHQRNEINIRINLPNDMTSVSLTFPLKYLKLFSLTSHIFFIYFIEL